MLQALVVAARDGIPEAGLLLSLRNDNARLREEKDRLHVLLSAGPDHVLRKGQVAFDQRGIAGRAPEVGSRSARVLLATDLNSRIPVALEGSRARSMMVGTNGVRSRLRY